MLDIVLDRCDEFLDRFEDAAPYARVGNLAKPTFHHVQPGTARRREVDVEAWLAFLGSKNLGMFVRHAVVHDHER